MTEHFKYEDMTDEELIDQLREGDRQVMDYICDKYKNLVRSKAKSMYILGGDSEDLIQEGMIGLFKAVRDYDCGRDASFYTFADLCISRQMYTAVQASQRLKHTPSPWTAMEEWKRTEIRRHRHWRSFWRIRPAGIPRNFFWIRKEWPIWRKGSPRS